MSREPFGKPYLIVPIKVFLRILSERDIVWRIRIDKVISFQRKLVETDVRKVPLREGRDVFREIRFVGDGFVAPEWNVEFVFTIEPA